MEFAQPIVEVQFSGNPKMYSYLVPMTALAVEPGNRVVVVSKMKDDNTPSLSIATVVNVGQCSSEAVEQLKLRPFVQIIAPERLADAVAAYGVAGAAG